MPQLDAIGRLMSQTNAGAGGATLPTIQPLSAWYKPQASAYINALVATGATITDARKYTIGRSIERLVNKGTAALGSHLNFIGPTEACWLINALNTSRNAVKAGSPTFVADGYVTTAGSNADYYATDFKFNEFAQNSNSMMLYSTQSSTASQAAPDMGVGDGTINWFINAHATTGDALRAAAFNTSAGNLGTATLFPGGQAVGINRNVSGSFKGYQNGIDRGSITATSGSTSSVLPITILKQNGSGASTTRRIQSAWLGQGLSNDQMEHLAAVLKNYDESITWGEPTIQPAGYGDAVVGADFIVVGFSPASFCAAWRASQLGYTVAMVGLAHEPTVSCFGGHPGNGLGLLDTATAADVSGLFRGFITFMNSKAGLSNNQTVTDMSLSPVWWNRAFRWCADPTKSDAALPGRAIKIYLSTGIREIVKVGTGFSRLTTNDGRVLQASGARAILVGGDYTGDSVYYSGCSFTTGTEAQGTAPGEDLNGYQPTDIEKLQDHNGNFYDVDCYVTPATPASGLLPTLVALPSITAGAPDPSLQSINNRISVAASTNFASIPWSYIGQSDTYNALNYEPIGRALAAITAAGRTPVIADILKIDLLHEGSRSDINSGPLPTTDMPQSGIAWMNAGTNAAARNAVILSIFKFDADLIWWVLNSGDSRIPAGIVTALAAYQLTSVQFLDPPEGLPIGWPCMIYDRDPVYQLKNTFNYNAHDTYATTGTPRSTNTVGMVQYRVDRHFPRVVGVGGLIYKQGPLNDNTNSKSCPVPGEAIMADASEFTDGLFPACPAFTKMAWYSGRMESTTAMMGEMSAFIGDYALQNGVSVQAALSNYATIRATALAAANAVPLVLAQVNAP